MKRLTKMGVSRNISIFIIFFLIILSITFFIVWLIPLLREQTTSLFEEFPNYYDSLSEIVSHFLSSDAYAQFSQYIDTAIESFSSSFSEFASNFISNTNSSLRSTIGAIVSVILGLITAPIMFFYLLKEDYKLPASITYIIPTKVRPTVRQFLSEINEQLSLYIRGQLIVALAVAIMFMIGYTVIGLPYGIALGIISGFLNIIPYLGSFIAMIPALIIAIVHSPFMVVKVLIVAFIEQTLEGRIISPKVLGTNLNVHPITILIVLLTAGQLYGFTGVVIGVPVYAVAKVFVRYAFIYFKKRTGVYDEAESEIIVEEKV